MERPLSWINISGKEKLEREQLFGENSLYRDPVISTPYGVVMPKLYPLSSNEIYNFDVRSDDIWVVTYKKCGTTWTQEIVWNIMNDVNKELGKLPLYSRSPFLERQTLFSNNMINKLTENLDPQEVEQIRYMYNKSIDHTANLPSPRIIKTHLPFELLPPKLLDKAKVIYVCRNPKDCCVSFYHHVAQVFKPLYDYNGTFDQFVQLFMQGKLEEGDYFHHLKGAWKLRHHRNMKFDWYEDMKNDPIQKVTEMTNFLNHKLSHEKIIELVEHLDFNNVKERASNKKKDFYRKGTVGDWKNYFGEDKLKLWDDWIAKNLQGTDIEFKFEL